MLVSVIVPAYNREKFIEETLRSVKEQAYRPLELIVVDNGSDDSTLSLCERFAASEHGSGFSVKVLSEKRRGASACRNTGARAATGRWLSFFDSDDFMSPDFISDAMKLAVGDVQLVAGATNIDDGKKVRRRVFRYSAEVEEQILTGELSTQSMIMRSDLFGRVGGWNESLPRWNDWELGVRILLACPVVAWLREKSYHIIRAHENSITGKDFSGSFNALMAACRAVESDLMSSQACCPRAVAALSYRVFMLSGILRREKSFSCSAEAKCYAEKLSAGRFGRMTGRLLMRYTSCGGRGAWLVARVLASMAG